MFRSFWCSTKIITHLFLYFQSLKFGAVTFTNLGWICNMWAVSCCIASFPGVISFLDMKSILSDLHGSCGLLYSAFKTDVDTWWMGIGRVCARTNSLSKGSSQYCVCFFLSARRGKFAVVKKCMENATGKEYAAKFLRKRRKGQDCRMDIINEIAILEIAKSNSHVVDLHEVYETTSEIILVLE